MRVFTPIKTLLPGYIAVAGESLPTIEEIYANHEEIVAEYDLEYPGVTARFPDEKLTRIIQRAADRNGPFERAAVFLKDIPRVHVFEDGNKRTAWLTAYEYLHRHGYDPTPDALEAEQVMKRRQRFSVSELALWLRTGAIDEERLQ